MLVLMLYGVVQYRMYLQQKNRIKYKYAFNFNLRMYNYIIHSFKNQNYFKTNITTLERLY